MKKINFVFNFENSKSKIVINKSKSVNCKNGENSENEKEIEKNVKKFKKVVDIMKYC